MSMSLELIELSNYVLANLSDFYMEKSLISLYFIQE